MAISFLNALQARADNNMLFLFSYTSLVKYLKKKEVLFMIRSMVLVLLDLMILKQ